MPSTDSQQIKFGEFILDLDRGTLQRSGEDVGLRPQAFEVLSYLSTRSGKLISRDELLDAVWGNATVTDDSLTQCIVEIRKAINDDAHTVIRTVPRRGFIFDPPDSKSAGAQRDATPERSAGSPAQGLIRGRCHRFDRHRGIPRSGVQRFRKCQRSVQ